MEDAAHDAEQEELDEARHDSFATFALDHLNDLIVRSGMEFHQDLAHNAHARFGSLAYERQRIEVLDDAPARLGKLVAVRSLAHLGFANIHPMVEQTLRCARFGFIGARTIERHHEQVAIRKRVHGLFQHGHG